MQYASVSAIISIASMRSYALSSAVTSKQYSYDATVAQLILCNVQRRNEQDWLKH